MDEKKLIELIDNKDEDGLVYFIENFAGLMKSVMRKNFIQIPLSPRRSFKRQHLVRLRQCEIL